MKTKLTKKETETISKRSLHKTPLVWDLMTRKEHDQAFRLCESYKTFLDQAKTERKAVLHILEQAVQKGFKNIDSQPPSASDSGRYFKVFRNKAVALAVTGKAPLLSGVNLIGSHIDSPRLDLKQNPLYEDVDLALLKTHYYGGIRKYQWLARPLALHGKVITSDGSGIELTIGESEDDPVFCVSDLLPHLARKLQGSKKISEAFEGEKLNLLAGSIPIAAGDVKNRFKLTVLNHLFEKYGMVEEDFVSAELEAVPADKARDIGLDRSLIGAYGQDDRACAFTSLEALCDLESPHRTAAAFFFDKEEIGSEGNTGAKSRFIEEFISDLLVVTGEDSSERSLRKCLMNSKALSADVNAAMDPDFQEVHEKNNAARLGYGVCMTKFTGSGGKSGSSDASAEFVGAVRKIFNTNKVAWQTGELGKIDEGGGGTIAKFLAAYGMDILDCGPALLSMHSPFEVSSKADLYMTCKAYAAFFKAGFE